MADCREYKEIISSYADGELSEIDKNELLAHLDECPSCRSLLSLYKSISGAAAESFVEPPENFTDNIMEKIKMLSENEKRTIPTAHKSKKSMRPVIISFVAAAACLALAFIVSPELFNFGGGLTNSAVSMPMASGANEAASQELALDDNASLYAQKADINADSSTTVQDGAGAAPQPEMGITSTSGSPVPAPSQAPGIASNGRGVSDELKNYYAVFVILEQLPDILKDAVMTDNLDGTFNIEISIETANQLIKDNFDVSMGAPEASIALVKYTPPS